MTPVELVLSLKQEIEDAVKDYRLLAENQEDRGITVYAQHIRDEIFDDREGRYYPLIIVSLQEERDNIGESGREASMATVGLTFGIFAEDKDGWMDLLNIMETVRQRILTNRTVANRHRLVEAVEWKAIEAQPYPFWFGYGTLKYSIAQPQEMLPAFDEDIIGDAVDTEKNFL